MGKKVVLINPRFPEKFSGFSISPSLLYLGSWLLHKGYRVCIVDALNIRHRPTLFEKIKSELSDAVCVGVSVMSNQTPSALEISKFVRQCAPSIPIVWGGVHPTLYPEQTARCEYVDFVVRGDGEVTLVELLEAIEQGSFQPDGIRGLAFRTDSNNVVLTPDREPLDINEVPPIAWKLVESLKPGSNLQKISELTEYGPPLLTSRGCPHRCSFCINSVTRSRYRQRRVDLVLDDIKTIIGLGVDRIWFADEEFFTNKRRVTELMTKITGEKLNFKWFANVRADYFRSDYLGSEDFLLRVKRCGCELVGIGAESGSQRILDMLKKDITTEDTLNAARLLNRAKIKANFSFMIGLPGEDENDYKQTLQLINEITKIDDSFSFLILGPQIYRPYPGSELYLECIRQGLKEPGTIEEWTTSPYIHLEYASKSYYNKSFYPWVKYSGDLSSLAFYAALSGIRLHRKPIARLLRLIGSTRCKKFYFEYPIEKKIYGLLSGSWIVRSLRP